MCFICFYDEKYRQYYEVLGDQEMWREAYLIFGLLNEVLLLASVTYVPKNPQSLAFPGTHLRPREPITYVPENALGCNILLFVYFDFTFL